MEEKEIEEKKKAVAEIFCDMTKKYMEGTLTHKVANKEVLSQLVKEAKEKGLNVKGDMCYGDYFLILEGGNKINHMNIDAISHFIKKYKASVYTSTYDGCMQIRIYPQTTEEEKLINPSPKK